VTSTPYQFIKRGSLFIIPVGPSIAEVPYPTQPYTKYPDYSLWVHGKITEPALHLDNARMPGLYQEVRDDLVRYSPVEVTRSAFQRSQHAYVGVIDSRGTPYYFALDSRGLSVREVDRNDDRVWKTFDRLAVEEHMVAVRKRRTDSAAEMVQVDHELREPILVVSKALRSQKAVQHRKEHKPPKPSPKTGVPTTRLHTINRDAQGKTRPSRAFHLPSSKPDKKPKEPKPTSEQKEHAHLARYEARLRGKQAIKDKLRAERQQLKPAKQQKPKASDERLNAWRAKHPGGNVEAMQAHPFAKSNPRLVIRVGDYAAEMRRVGALHAAECGEEDLDPPRPEDFEVEKATLPNGRAKGHKLSDLDQEQLRIGARHEREHTTDKDIARRIAADHLVEDQDYYKKLRCVEKALPKKAKEEKPKKTPNSKATKKQAGAGGKTRYTYPGEKKGGAKKPGAKTTGKPAPLIVEHDDTKNANPDELANQLGVSVRTLQRTAKRLGRDGFTKFMRPHLKRFAAKHRLDPDYWGTLYEKLRASDVKVPA
jgi:hypothetical protein